MQQLVSINLTIDTKKFLGYFNHFWRNFFNNKNRKISAFSEQKGLNILNIKLIVELKIFLIIEIKFSKTTNLFNV